jgi:hypothetical protein
MYIHIVMVVGSFLLLVTFICTTILEFRAAKTQEAV